MGKKFPLFQNLIKIAIKFSYTLQISYNDKSPMFKLGRVLSY